MGCGDIKNKNNKHNNHNHIENEPKILDKIEEKGSELNQINNKNKFYNNKKKILISENPISIKDKDSEKINENSKEKINNYYISLGINIGASKTVYSIFSKVNGQYITNVLLMNYSRIIPSIISYPKNHRLFGDNSFSSLKKNISNSLNNLSRLIGLNDEEYKEECEYMFSSEKNLKLLKEKGSECIIADFLSLIKEYYFEKEKIEYDFTTISVPDFYDYSQREELKLICESIEMKDVKIIDESTAITMYYGYTKYKDLFEIENNLDKNIEINILFIDCGYSKSTFILSHFKYNEFNVENVICIPNFGGRIFDKKIFNYCIDKFKEKYNMYNLLVTDKMKYRLLEVINKQRPILTINDEIKILVDAFYENKDLEIYITREEFETQIFLKDEIFDLFLEKLKEMKKFIDEKKIKLDCVEIAGEFIKTPLLQTKIEEIFDPPINKNTNKKISTSLLVDECASVGATIFSKFIYGDFPNKFLETFRYYIYNDKLNSFPKILEEKEKIKEYIELKLKINKNENEKEQFKKKIFEYIKIQKDQDNEYNQFMKEKSNISKKIFQFKKIINNEIQFDKQLKEINQLERELRNIQLKEKKIQSIKEKLEQFYENSFNIEKEMINKEIENILKLIEQHEIKVDKKNEIKNNIIECSETLKNLEKKENDYLLKLQELIEINKTLQQSKQNFEFNDNIL